MFKKHVSIIIALISLLSCFQSAYAQDDETLPIYIVQPGENLTEIANKFHISIQDLINANNIPDVNIISEGSKLFIPGLEGVSGILITKQVDFGEHLETILRQNQLNLDNFKRLNSITSPAEIYVGSTLVLPQPEQNQSSKSNVVVDANQSLFSVALQNGLNPWVIAINNEISVSTILPGDVLFFEPTENPINVSIFSNSISNISVRPLPVSQGHTMVVYIYAKSPGKFFGNLDGKSFNFFEDKENGYYYGLNGVSAIAEPGLVPLSIEGEFENGDKFSAEQNLLLTSGGYQKENLSVENTTIEQSIIEEENKLIQEVLNIVSPQKLWNEKFRFPVDGSLDDGSIAFSSYFGSRRSYNNGQYVGYHGGLDFKVVLMSLNIYSVAPGRVIFAGPMNIRGNTIFIDHGQGVISGYAHMKEFTVSEGDMVEKGQLIGLIGNTGRVTGPHLHWDIWVNRTPVDPFDWVNNNYP